MTKNPKVNKKIIKRIITASIVLIIAICISFTMIYWGPYIIYQLNERIDANKNQEILIKNKYCVIGFRLNEKNIFNRDTIIKDSCIAILTFDEQNIIFNFSNMTLKGKYKIRGKYKISIFDSSNNDYLRNSEYSISLTKRSVNILSSEHSICGLKMKN